MLKYQFVFWYSARSWSLNDLTYELSFGLPGREKSKVTRCRYAQ